VKPGILYISYDGMLEPLGQSQVLAYVEKLAPGRRIHLMSFEKSRDLADQARVKILQSRMQAHDIVWHPQRYHKRPPVLSSVYDLGVAAIKAWWIVRRERLEIVHARNLLCACMGLPAAKTNGARLLFDIRGFWADERIDGGMIRRGGVVYRVLKWLDKALLKSADHIVTLTSASLPYLQNDPAFGLPSAPISVIPTCVDLDLFKPPVTPRGGDAPFVLGYVGQVGTWYLFDKMAALFAAIRDQRPDARMLIVNQHQHQHIQNVLERHGIDASAYELVPAAREQVPALIGRMTIGMALIKPAFSKISSCPTKLAEYLACGVPCVGNPGVGDVAETLTRNRVGVVVDNGLDADLDRAADAMLALSADPDLARRCRETAEREFSLVEGARAYDAIYRKLERKPGPSPLNGHHAATRLEGQRSR
jgi:glycosyltransferase involved in cell wall biosynthesis